MAINKKRIYELTDEQTTLTDTDLGVLDKSGYDKAKKFSMLNLYNYIASKNTNEYLYTEVLLSADDVRSLNWNTGFNLLPALPNGNYYDIDKMAYEFNCDDGNFTCSNPGTYLTAWCGNIIINIVSISLLTSSLDSRYILCPTGPEQISNSDEVPYFASSNNTNSLQLDLYLGINNNSDVITDGANSTLRVKIWYRVRTFGTEL